MEAARLRGGGPLVMHPQALPNSIRTSMCDKYSGSMEDTTHLDHMSHCKTASGKKMFEKMDLPSIYHESSP